MPILEHNIVFVESQVMDDVPEGGGAATGRAIEDGRMNNVFPDISDLDRAYGRFNLRKVFLAVRTLSTDMYSGAKTVVTALPQDDALGYTLFSSGDPFDTRSDAADRVAAYLYKGPTWRGYLLENHIAGMRAISVLQRIGSPLPPVGKTLCLVLHEGTPSEVEQYVRVTEVSVAVATFTDGTLSSGEDLTFDRWIVTLSLSDALRADFPGHVAARADSAYTYTGKTRIRDTTVADAASYFGAQPLTVPANVGDTTVRAASMYASLVPSSQTERPLVNRPLTPTATVTVSAGSRMVEIAQQAHTHGLRVTAESRALNWVTPLNPLPAPGALNLSYRANGIWYDLADDGEGVLAGSDAALGAGTVNYTTGALAVTLGALPDAGSTIVLAWGSPAHYVSLVPESPAPARMVFESPDLVGPIVPGSVMVTWTSPRQGDNPGTVYTATDATAGTISGNGMSGTIDYSAPRIALDIVPIDAGSDVVVSYERVGVSNPAPPGSSVLSWTFGVAVRPRTVRVPVSAEFAFGPRYAELADSLGDGNLRIAAGDLEFASTIVGTVDYATGDVVVTAPTATATERVWTQSAPGSGLYGWFPQQTAAAPIAVDWSRAIAGGVVTAFAASASQTVPVDSAPAVRVGLATSAPALVPGSLEIQYGGKTYVDRAGVLYTDITAGNPGGIPAGTVGYASRDVLITRSPPGTTGTPVITSALGRYGDWTATEMTFRIESSPVKPQSLTITATTSGTGSYSNSEQITATSDPDGNIVGAWAVGEVNYEMGVATVRFGANAAGEVTIPREVDPASVRYSAVSYRYLPLDADILGIDAVRLPADGRVPIYRPGDLVMVMHTAETAPQNAINGTTIHCGRARLAWAKVVDADGVVRRTGYMVDRAAGLVVFTDVAGMAMPVRVRHTVGDLRQVTDAQITGEIALSRPLTHDYPAGEAIVSSCLLHGDRRARVSAVWDQAIWNGTWSDTLAGSEATASLDVIAHPIELTNEGAETERWLLRWTSTTNVELIGQRRGLVYSGPFNADVAPINPRTRAADGSGGVPYLRIPVAANGGGWAAGNVVRINTVGALADIWIARSIQQSDEPLDDGADGVEICVLGNIDRT